MTSITMLPSGSAMQQRRNNESTTQNENMKIGDYTLLRQIGSGSFGKVYLAVDDKNQEVAIKLESNDVTSARLVKENQLYLLLLGGIGIPNVHWFGHKEDYTVLVMDALGPSLNDLFQRCFRRFSLKTVLMLADQLLIRLEFLHSRYFVHRDVKPANFVMGTGSNDHIVYMIDFGLSDRFCDYTMKHSPNRSRFGIGTPLFSSANTHYKMTPSRRDDLESLAYMFIFFLKGSLPWEGLKGRRAVETWGMIADQKLSVTADQLCEGIPEEFSIFLKYCRKLQYEEKPDYNSVREMFRLLGQRLKYDYDCEYDWTKPNPQVSSQTPPPSVSHTPPPTSNEQCPITCALNNLALDN